MDPKNKAIEPVLVRLHNSVSQKESIFCYSLCSNFNDWIENIRLIRRERGRSPSEQPVFILAGVGSGQTPPRGMRLSKNNSQAVIRTHGRLQISEVSQNGYLMAKL